MEATQTVPTMAPPSNKKKIFLIFGVVLVVIILGILLFLFWQMRQNEGGASRNLPLPTQATGQTKSGIDIAAGVAKFLETTQLPDGTFISDFYCSKTASPPCKELPTKNPHGGQIIMTFYDLHKKTGNEAYKTRADERMTAVMERCKTDLSYCEWNFFPLFVYYQDTKDTAYLDAMMSVESNIVKPQPLADHVSGNIGPKLEMLYNLTRDEKYKTLLIQYADRILAGELELDDKNDVIFLSDNYTLKALNLRGVWSDIMPAYRVTKDQKYLQYTTAFMNSLTQGNRVDDLISASIFPTSEGSTAPPRPDISTLLFIMEVELSLSTADPSGNWSQKAQATAEKVYQGFADTPENKKYDGSGGFLNYAVSESFNTKNSLANGWIARLYIRMGDQQFSQ